MKKKSVYGFMLVAFCFILVSCGNVFSKVQIKAKPSIYAPLGKEEFKMSTYVTVEKIEELLGGGKENSDFPFKIYDYDGDKDGALAFRLYYPLMDFDLDFGNYLEGMDLSSFKTAIPKIDFTVPTLDGLSVENQTLIVPGTEGFSGTLNEVQAQAVNETLKNTDPRSIDNKTIPITGSGLKSVKFANTDNTITMTLEPTLKGMTCTPTINITLPDGTTIPFSSNSSANTYVADFGGQTITPGDLTIGGAVTLGGSVEAGEPVPPERIGVKIAFDVGFKGGFESATVAVPEGANFNQSVDFEFPEEAKKMVESVTFLAGKLGFDLTVTSTLPQGNDIDMSINAFDENLYKTIESNVWSFRTTTDYVLKPEKPLSATIKVTPPGYNESEKTMTIKNVAPGTSYSLSGEAKIIADWKSITLKDTATDPFVGSFPAAGAEPIDLSKFTELLPEGIAFKDIGSALFISSPIKKGNSETAGTGLSFKGNVSISGGDGGPIDLIPEESKNSLSLVNPVELPAEGKVWSGDLPTPSVDMGKGITDFLNSRPTSLNLNYSLSLGNGTTISKDSLPEDGKTSVKAEIVITLPIKLSVTQNAEFDVFALANIPTDKDLFGRTEAPATNEQINDLLKMLTSLNIGIDYNNNLGVALGAKVHLLTDKDGKPTVTKDFMLEKGKNTYNLELTGEQIKQVMEAYPFCPRVYVELPSEDVVLEREGGIDLSLGVTAVTDINYIYDLKGGK